MLEDGVWRKVSGCTTVSGLFPDDGWKFAWPVKLMYETAMQEFSVNRNIDGFRLDIIDGILLKAKNAWRQKRDKSADTGTIGHELIEEWIKRGVLPTLIPGTEVENIFNQFMLWEGEIQPKWLASEIQVGSLKHGFCGILDAVAEINGKIVLVDFKTSGSIKDDYAIQLAGLQICLEEMEANPMPVERAILHLPKEGEYEYRQITGDLEADKRAFLAALEFYKHKNLFAARCK